MQETGPTPMTEEDLREFLLLVRRALLMIIRWIERRYRLEPNGD